MRSGQLRLSQGIRQRPPLAPGRHCGADFPLEVSAFDRQGIALDRAVPMTCPMVVATERWLDQVVQPAAIQTFGSRVVAMQTHGTYSCRRIMHRSRGSMSEHAFANALDVAGFTLEDGRRVRVGRPTAPGLPSPWRFQDTHALGVDMDGGGIDLISIGPGIDGARPPEINFGAPDARGFWRSVRDGGCRLFSTVLGPGSDGAHEEHLHLDLARRVSRQGGERRVCR